VKTITIIGIAVTTGFAAACSHATAPQRREPRMFRDRIERAAPARELDGGPQGAAEAMFANRAFPDQDVPADAADRARETFEAIAANGASPGLWEIIGPDRARYPGLLTYTGKDYVASGRVTALAIGPTCRPSACRLWVGAAGGGVWRTDRALGASPAWTFVSRSFASNAIGSLTIDPTDPTGNTVYAGTGEPNASSDSDAGVGIYKTTDGGDSWTRLAGSLAAFNGRAVSAVAVDPTNPNTLWVGSARAIRGITSVTGGGVTLNPAYPGWGLWKSTDGGATFTSVVTNSSSADGASPVGIRGITDLSLDPRDPSVVYYAAFHKGIWRVGGGSLTQIFVPAAPANSSDRTAFAVTVKNSKLRIYAGNGQTGSPYSRVWRTDDADAVTPATWISLTSSDKNDPKWATFDFCTGQCWYDIGIVTPKGYPDTVFVLGSFQYGEYWRVSNARGVLLSTTAGEPDPAHNNRTFTDVTWAATPNWQPDGIHPDQHALVVSPENPNIFFEGSDGGVMRSDGIWQDVSDQCAGARRLTDGNLIACQRLLSRVPRSLVSLNDNLTTLQFQSLSINPQKPLHSLLGGTQDNGTFDYNSSSAFWSQAINGDGGQSGYDALDDKVRFHTYYGPYVDVDYNNADPKGWVWISDPFIAYPENWNFYVPIIPDPVVGGSMFLGEQHIWRTLDNGGDRATLQYWCWEIKGSAQPTPPPALCGDWEPMGGAWQTAPGDLTHPVYGDRSGAAVFSYIAAVARSSGDQSTLWAATNTGRLFISRNANAVPAGAVAYSRLDDAPPAGTTRPPGRFVSGIAIDPTNPNHAFISYTGYNVTTPATPGHVFEAVVDPVTNKLVSFTSLNVEGASGDLPINGIARDDHTGDLYVATDFGVLRRDGSAGTWTQAGSGLPMAEVAGLAISTSARVLYAATHGRSAWRLALP